MPRRHFTADLQRLCEKGVLGPHITDVNRGGDDGTFQFTFNAKRPGIEGVEVCGTIPELAEYPFSHQLFVYITSSDPPPYATNALLELDLNFHDVEQAIKKISEKLLKALDSAGGDGSGPEDFEDSDGLESSDESEDSVGGGWSDDGLRRCDSRDTPMADLGQETAQTELKRRRLTKELREDLRRAKNAGFRVAVLGDYAGGMSFYVSLGIRIGKLGISDEALIAWKLDRTHYFIVLIHYTSYYKNIAQLTGSSLVYHGRKDVSLCVGKSANYKPTFQEAITAFSKVTATEDSQEQHPRNTNDGSESDVLKDNIGHGGAFQGIFISGPINQLLNTALIPLLKYRMTWGFSWDGAEFYYNSLQGKDSSGSEQIDAKFYENLYENRPPKQTLVPLVMADALSDVSGDAGLPSFPLVAMQFALRHLVRCTEFCLVCHNKVSTDFEALKPYVCSSPLCLYQYMSLGFGPSIEYEIMSQPTVVDLLVSFCYASAKLGKLEHFPDGMDLKIYTPASMTYSADFHRIKNEFLFPESGSEHIRAVLKDGDWIVMNVSGIQSEEWHACITETCYWPIVKVASPISVKLGLHDPSAGAQSTDTTSGVQIPGLEDVREVQFKVYGDAFDTATDHDKRKAITSMLNTLPSIAEMKAWLQRNLNSGGEVTLRKFKNKLSPSALGLLRWIIASNRSCIVPLEDDDESVPSGFSPVQGMSPGWKQFRFAMGAPDKEQRFVNSVREAQTRLNSKFPSLFAFHGSPIANWHSIIREGLHFKQTLHGRAFGHGCYHSLDLKTSMNYSMSHSSLGATFPAGFTSGSTIWPQSELKITCALSLNEIVNSPREFVSKTPHLVVAQLDWIQTRYLFVQVQRPATTDAKQQAKELPPPPQPVELPASKVHPQDPSYTPQRDGIRLIIPATPSSRGRGIIPSDGDIAMFDSPSSPNPLKRRLKGNGKGLSKIVKIFTGGLSVGGPLETSDDDECASVATDDEDLRALLSDEESVSKDKGKRKIRPDEFIPDSLDTTRIQFLAPPSYASTMASRRLNSDIKSLIQLQESTPLHELGFYINPKHVENVYQWIVELHSFPEHLPLVQDMRAKSPVLRSIVLEIRFGPQYPMSPPFVRIVQPRFLGFQQGGGGNVTLGGAMCMELLTNTGWSAVSTVESVLMQVRMALMDEQRPARLENGPIQSYSVSEAVEAFKRACRNHGWAMPEGMDSFLK